MNSQRYVASLPSACRGVLCALAVGLALPVGCGGVNQLREAQSAFNEAAALENSLRFDPERLVQADGSATVGGLASVQSGYAAALHSLEALDSNEEQALKHEKLWGVALTLKALTYWRLGRHDEALDTAATVNAEASDQLFPRDAAVVRALPGLVKTDLAYQYTVETATLDAVAKANSLAKVKGYLLGNEGAQGDLKAALAKVDAEHPVRVYLLQAKLATYRNLRVAYQKLDDETNLPMEAKTQAAADLKGLNSLLRKLGAGEARERIVTTWSRLLNLDAP